MFGDQLADRGDELARHFHDRLAGLFEGGLILGDGFVLGLRLVVGEDLLDSLFVPAGRELVLGHSAISSSVDGAYRPSRACLQEYTR